MTAYTQSMVDRIEEYLAYRRGLGFELRIAGQQLLAFARYADYIGHSGPLTTELAVDWSRSSPRSTPLNCARRLEVVRSFARFAFAHDGVSEVPPLGLLGPSHRRIPPYIYSEQEVIDLLDAAGGLSPSNSLRPATFTTLFGLLASTGLRISEAIALTRADVDLVDGVLMIRRTQFRKSRYVPLAPSVMDSLGRYEKHRNRDGMTTPHESFFLLLDGEPLSYRRTRTAFQWIRRRLGWTTRMPRPPRIHDLRHTFACRRILLWHKQGVDVDVAIYSLSTYLGHAKVTGVDLALRRGRIRPRSSP